MIPAKYEKILSITVEEVAFSRKVYETDKQINKIVQGRWSSYLKDNSLQFYDRQNAYVSRKHNLIYSSRV